MKIFISYRRDDSGPTARLLDHVLGERFGSSSVFMDLEDVARGADFAEVIGEHLERADVVLAIVGPQWARLLQERAEGGEVDWVRREVAMALERRAAGGLRVVPVFVDGAKLPRTLPPDVLPLAKLNGVLFETRASDEGERRVVEAILDETFDRRIDRQTRERRARWSAAGLGVLVFLAAWAQLLDSFGIDTQVHLWTLRLSHLAGPPPLPPPAAQLAIVALDDAAQAATPSRSLRRAELARAVSQAASAGAKALAIDFEFDEPGDEAADAAFAAALAAARPVLPVVLAVKAGIGNRDGDGPKPSLLPRFAEQARWGLACVGQRRDVVATLPLVALRESADGPAQLIPSIGLATFAAAQGGRRLGELDKLDLRLRLLREGERDIVVSGFGAEVLGRDPEVCNVLRRGDLLVQQWLDERAPPIAGIGARVALGELARGDPAALAALKDRIVIVGDLRQAVSEDTHHTASGAAQGVTLVAAQIDGLLRGTAIRALSPLEQGLLLVGSTLAGAALAIALRGPRARLLLPAIGLAALVFVAAAVAGYRSLRVLAGPHYAVLALMLGAWLARRFQKT